MWRVKPVYSRVRLIVLVLPDILTYGFGVYLQEPDDPKLLYLGAESAFMLMLVWLSLSYLAGLYVPSRFTSWKRILTAMLQAMGWQFLVAGIFSYFGVLQGESTYGILLYCLLLAGVSCCSRLLFMLMYLWRCSGSGSRGRFIILGYTPESKALAEHLKTVGKHHQFLGFFDDEAKHEDIQGKLSEVKDFCCTHQIHDIYVCGGEREYLIDLFHFANQEYMYLHYFSPDLLPDRKKLQNLELEEGLSVLLYQPSRRKQWKNKWLNPQLATTTH